jgi:hypothetical protein
MTIPPLYSVPGAGCMIVPVGAWFEVTVSMASLLRTLPKSLVTRARKRAPLSV